MNSTDTAQTWHDLADQLTPAQVAYLENWEQHPELPPMADGTAPPAARHRGALLFCAQEYAGCNAAAKRCAHLPTPAGALCVDGWRHYGDGEYYRILEGTTRTDAAMQVIITGQQHDDGRVEREITLEGAEYSDGRMTAVQARAAAHLLLAAADELDQLDGGHPVDSATRTCCRGIGGHTQGCQQ